MRSLIVLGAAASLLTLAACNRDADTAAPADEAAAAGDAGADASAAGVAGSSGAATATTGADGGAATAYPTNDPMPPAEGPGPVTDATRDGAKEAAEATNLHPKTN